jgi:uncharacterized protein
MPYLDTSVLGSYYCPESLSAAVAQALAGVRDPIISPLVELEFLSLLSLKVRTCDLTESAAHAALGQFRAHLANGEYRLIEIGPREYELAGQWLGAFRTPLRTLDALHLAAAAANRLQLFTTDVALAHAAAQLRVGHKLISR